MQKFKFKLDGLLKVREFNEKKIKIELGEILREITAVEDKIAELYLKRIYKEGSDIQITLNENELKFN
jgi:flagellar biosynthesis chaperone FliJ